MKQLIKKIDFKKVILVIKISLLLFFVIGLFIYIKYLYETKLPNKIEVNISYDKSKCYEYFNTARKPMEKEIAKQFIQGVREKEIDDEEIIKFLIEKEVEIKGLESVFRDPYSLYFNIKNNSNKTVEKIKYSVGVRKIGFSNDLAPYEFKYLYTDKIIKPGDSYSFCLGKNLTNIDPYILQEINNYEFYLSDKEVVFY